MDKYTVEVLAHQENMLLLQMFYDGVLVTETECSEHCVDFLKETMFNYNSGKLRLPLWIMITSRRAKQVVMESMRLLSNV